LGSFRKIQFAGRIFPYPHKSEYNEGVGVVGPVQWAKAHFFVAMKEAVASKIEEVAQRVTESEGLELVEVEVKGGGSGHRLVRIAIDKPEGVTHGDCENVSQQVGTILDVEDLVPGGRYTLEVSSPGVERKLHKPQDYQRFQGKKASITLRQPVEGSKHWDGILTGFQDGVVTLELKPGKSIAFPFDQITKAHLKFEW
jgi:ribosome maturation factor RimP